LKYLKKNKLIESFSALSKHLKVLKTIVSPSVNPVRLVYFFGKWMVLRATLFHLRKR